METTKLSSKGQVIIPKVIRESHHWQPGTEFAIEETAAGLLLKPRKPFPSTRLENGVGCAGYKDPAKILEEMEEGIAADIRKKWRKGEKR